MNDFFATIYSWFCDGSLTVFKIMDVVWGDDGELLLSGAFSSIGITTVVISFLIAIAFYIWPINHPRFKAWWAWLIMLLVNVVINWALAFAFIQYRKTDIETSEDALYLFTDDTTLSIPVSQWMDFAFANLGVSIIFFIVASLVLNWFSTNCRLSPFRK